MTGKREGNSDRRSTLRERKKRQTRDEIQNVARELFNARGFRETTIRDIAEEAGVGVGTIFAHFPDKENLFMACVAADLEAMDQHSWATLPREAPIQEQLLHLARKGFEGWSRRPTLSREVIRQMYFAEGPSMERLRALDRGTIQRLTHHLEEAQGQGTLRKDACPHLAARTVFSFYLTTVLDWLEDLDTGKPGVDSTPASSDQESALERRLDEVRRFLEQVFRGIGAQEENRR